MVKMARSRIGQARLAQLLGNEDFPVVISSELLARRITVQAHKEDHGLTTGCRKNRNRVGLQSQGILLARRAGRSMHPHGAPYTVSKSDSRGAAHLLAPGDRAPGPGTILKSRQLVEDDVIAICPADIFIGRPHQQRPKLAALSQLPQDLEFFVI